MNISYNWIKQYLDINLDPEIVSTLLTDCGLEVEGLEKVTSVKGGLEGIVIGEVVSCVKHPNAEKLTLTKVDVGQENLLSIVCGAPNVKAGQKVPVATIGCRLYMGDDSFVIKKTKLRGELSEGMICAEDELGLGTDHDGIMVLDETAKIGQAAKDYFNIEEDWIFEIGLTPNRTDAMSHIGVARDLMAVIQNSSDPDIRDESVKLNIPEVDSFTIGNQKLDIKIQIDDTEACPRYSGCTVYGVKVTESPDWLKNRLNSIGVRPINNIVDTTNYVLFETGQPLHAFNTEKITSNKVIVKKLPQNTKFVSLDEQERKLTEHDLMICNTEEGMCIAGVFGGIDSGVDEKTKNIFLESACFDPKTIRKTAKYHTLQTDASFRFERGTDPNGTVYALKRAALMISEIAGGTISSEVVDIYPEPVSEKQIKVSLAFQ